MNIIAFDQASAVSGFVVYTYDRELDFATILEFGIFDFKKVEDVFERVVLLTEGVKSLIERYHPELVVVEEIYLGKNVKTFEKLAKVQVAIRLAAHWLGVNSRVVSPNTARSHFRLKDKAETAAYMTDLFEQLAKSKLDITDAALLGWYHIQSTK